MKKLMKKLNFAIIGIMASVPAMAAPSANIKATVCALAVEFGNIFSLLRTLTFVAAGFTIATWAWGWISKPADLKFDDVQKKGLGMLIGFIILFSLGAIISAFMAMTGEGGPFGCINKIW